VRRIAVTPLAAFDARRYAQAFWNDRLLPAADRATDVAVLTAALGRDSDAAAAQYGRRAGLGGNALFLVRGTGRIDAIDRQGLRISVDRRGNSSVLIPVGPIFGNVLRDGSGLLDAKDFSSFDFNALSGELNAIAETVAQSAVQRAAVGGTLSFAGGAEATSASGRSQLTVVPISIEFPK
jgi:hypothetical protein